MGKEELAANHPRLVVDSVDGFVDVDFRDRHFWRCETPQKQQTQWCVVDWTSCANYATPVGARSVVGGVGPGKQRSWIGVGTAGSEAGIDGTTARLVKLAA